ncbi:MAG: shikimate dehydrogenase [bacterium]
MELSGHTKPYAVLGHPICHSLSPRMHNAAFAALRMDAAYMAFDVEPARLMKVLPVMADMGFGGINLTVPLKEIAFRGLRKLDEPARKLGAVNTVEIGRAGLCGHNTDGPGFLSAIKETFGCGVKGASVFVAGAGGAGRAIAITCAMQKAGRVMLADVVPGKVRGVVDEISRLVPSARVSAVSGEPAGWVGQAGEADLVVNATPAGMHKGDKSPLSAGAFREGQMAFDLVYMFPETVFMKAAAKAGARTANGLGMLLHQGVLAFEIWTGVKPPVKVMREALESAVYGRMGTAASRHPKR